MSSTNMPSDMERVKYLYFCSWHFSPSVFLWNYFKVLKNIQSRGNTEVKNNFFFPLRVLKQVCDCTASFLEEHVSNSLLIDILSTHSSGLSKVLSKPLPHMLIHTWCEISALRNFIKQLIHSSCIFCAYMTNMIYMPIRYRG